MTKKSSKNCNFTDDNYSFVMEFLIWQIAIVDHLIFDNRFLCDAKMIFFMNFQIVELFTYFWKYNLKFHYGESQFKK